MTTARTRTIKMLRSDQYAYNLSAYPYLRDWRRNPYTCLKARFYMETSAVLVYLLLKTRISPNAVTIAYALAGVIGCVLLASGLPLAHLAAAVIFFSKGILDWSDGHLARATGRTSLTGHVLDLYGAHVNALAFQIGLGLYSTQLTRSVVFVYLALLLVFLQTVNLFHFTRQCLFGLSLSPEGGTDRPGSASVAAAPAAEISAPLRKVYSLVNRVFDDRARSVDFICLVIACEQFTSLRLTPVIFAILLCKQFFLFAASAYAVIGKRWVEQQSAGPVAHGDTQKDATHGQ